MTMYLHLGNQIGTVEARDLAQQLGSWHDAMVRHLRVTGQKRGPACVEECPHDEAAALWSAAQQIFGERAHDLAFLRAHGQRVARPMRRPPEASGRDSALMTVLT
jgi:hypothetical protein